jgi:hypothetical protein
MGASQKKRIIFIARSQDWTMDTHRLLVVQWLTIPLKLTLAAMSMVRTKGQLCLLDPKAIFRRRLDVGYPNQQRGPTVFLPGNKSGKSGTLCEGSRPIRLAGSTLGNPAHICAFFNSAHESHRVLLPYIRLGLDNNESVLSCCAEK